MTPNSVWKELQASVIENAQVRFMCYSRTIGYFLFLLQERTRYGAARAKAFDSMYLDVQCPAWWYHPNMCVTACARYCSQAGTCRGGHAS